MLKRILPLATLGSGAFIVAGKAMYTAAGVMPAGCTETVLAVLSGFDHRHLYGVVHNEAQEQGLREYSKDGLKFGGELIDVVT